MKALWVVSSLIAIAIPTAARSDVPGGVAREALTQFRWTVAPGVYFPSGGGDPGFALSDHIGYGISAGPLVISPGLSVPFYFVPNNFTLAVLGEAQVHFPIAMISPYALGGLGAGFLTGAGSNGFAFRFGGGLMVYATPRLGIGAELSYLKIDQAELAQLVAAIHLEL